MAVEAIANVGVDPVVPVKPVVGGEPLWSCLENIIDKKINKVSLNIFESLVDFLCSYLYSGYNKRFEFQASQVNFNHPVAPVVPAVAPVAPEAEPMALPADLELDLPTPPAAPAVNAIAGKVFEFQNGGKLYDQTANNRVKLEDCPYTHPLTHVKKVLKDQILIDGRHIVFDKFADEVFGHSHGTKHVVVCENKEFPELVMIYERDVKENMKAWAVNTTVTPWVNVEVQPDGGVKFLPSYVSANLIFEWNSSDKQQG